MSDVVGYSQATRPFEPALIATMDSTRNSAYDGARDQKLRLRLRIVKSRDIDCRGEPTRRRERKGSTYPPPKPCGMSQMVFVRIQPSTSTRIKYSSMRLRTSSKLPTQLSH